MIQVEPSLPAGVTVRRCARKRVACLVAWLAMALPLLAAGTDKFRGSATSGALVQYVVTVDASAGDDVGAIAKQLTATYGMRLQLDGDSSHFAIVASEARARLLSTDPRVTRVEEATANHRPAEVASTSVPGLGNYAYDKAGNIIQAGERTFTYDRIGRLSTVVNGATNEQQYTYDRYGNLLTMSITAVSPSGVKTTNTTRLGANPANNRIDQNFTGSLENNVVATYDAFGNIKTSPTGSFQYDQFNMVRESTVGGRTLYLYSASDERVASIQPSLGKETWTLRDASGRVLRRMDRISGTWAWTEDYVYGAGRLIASAVPNQAKVLHYHLDHLGTPRLITGNGGAQIGQHDYYAFGLEVAGGTNDGEQLKFTGHERDVPTLDYMHARYYDPSMGRFLSVDPVLDTKRAVRRPQMWNRYTYVTNNPINATDPDGRAENRVSNQLDHDQLAVIHGEMTMDQYNANNAARFNGAMTGLTIAEGIGTLRSLAALLLRGGSGLARGSIGLDAAIARGAVREGGALGKIISGIEAGFKSGGPKSADKALELVAKSAEAAGKQPGTLVKATDGAKYVLQNVGDVKTFIYKTGEVIVKKGDDILVRYIPK